LGEKSPNLVTLTLRRERAKDLKKIGFWIGIILIGKAQLTAIICSLLDANRIEKFCLLIN
jgi:hypothetical protein